MRTGLRVEAVVPSAPAPVRSILKQPETIAAEEAKKKAREREKAAARKRWVRVDFSKQEEESYVQAARPLWGLGDTDEEEEATPKVVHLARMRGGGSLGAEAEGHRCTRPTTATGAATAAAAPGPAANAAAASAEGATAASKQLGPARSSGGGPPTDGEQWLKFELTAEVGSFGN